MQQKYTVSRLYLDRVDKRYGIICPKTSTLNYLLHPKTYPRLLALEMQGQKPNEVGLSDFFYVGSAHKTSLTLSNTFLSWRIILVRTHSSISTEVQIASQQAPTWAYRYHGLEAWVGSLSTKNQTPQHHWSETTEEWYIRRHYSTTYCPLENGTVGRLCKEVLCTTKALLSERHLSP